MSEITFTPAIAKRGPQFSGPTAAGTDGQVLTSDGVGGSAWETPSGGGVTDHGALTGLSDNDHPQYELAANKGAANGYAPLDASSLLADSYIPASIARDAEVAAAVSAHESDTTGVHGIADTSALLDTSDIGVSVQAHDADLTAIAGLSPSNDDVLQRKAGAWANRTIAQLLTDLGAVVGPAGATNLAIAIYDLTTGKVLKNSLVTIDASGNIIVPSGTYIGVTSGRAILFGGAGNVDVLASGSVRLYSDNAGSSAVFGSNEGGFALTNNARKLRAPAAASPTTIELRGGAGSGTNVAGADAYVEGGPATGNSASGKVRLRTSTVGSSGTTTQTLSDRVIVDNVGGVNILNRDSAPATPASGVVLQCIAGVLGAINQAGAAIVYAALSVVQAWTKQQYFGTATLTDGANISWNLDDAQVAKVTLGGNRTLDNPTNMKDGATYVLRVIQDGTGSRTLAYGTAYKFPGGTDPTLSTGANDIDILTFVSDGTSMFGVFSGDFS